MGHVLSARWLAVVMATLLTAGAARAETQTPSTKTPSTQPPATATPKDATQPKSTTAPTAPAPPPSATSPAPATPGGQSPQAAPAPKTPGETPAPDKLAPDTKPDTTEVEPHGSPGVPQNATTESVDVPARPVVMIAGRSSYDDAFKSIKASIDAVKAAIDKAGLKQVGHPITIFSEPDKDGFKYQSAIPIAAPPDKVDLPSGVTFGTSPAGQAIKFQHRGAYDDIDSTYDVITTFLDAKGLRVDNNPYIEEYLTDLTTSDDPNLQVDIYVFTQR